MTPDDAPLRVLLIGAGAPTRDRLESLDGFVVVDGDADAEAPDVVFVSTRTPRTEAVSHVVAHQQRCPVVALVHTGGELLAADLLRAGARGLLAEGNEATVRAFLTATGEDTGLLEVYDRQVGRSQFLGNAQRSHCTVTGLPNASAFEGRMAEAQLAGDIPRVGFIRLIGLQQGDPRVTHGAVDLIRRRLAVQFRRIAASYEIELFALGPIDLAFFAERLSPDRVEALGADLSRVAVAFAPWGQHLAVAVGHAALEQRSMVVGAETLSLGASSTTELEAALRLVDVVERHDPLGPGQAERVAELAAAISFELGYERRTGSAIRLAANLADVGKVSLPVPAMFPEDPTDAELAAAFQSHPVRGADYVRPLAGAEIAAAIRAHHERWDGTGFPDALAGEQIPVAARIIAIAGAYVRRSAERGHGEALACILEQAGKAFDPAIVEAATPLLSARLAAQHGALLMSR